MKIITSVAVIGAVVFCTLRRYLVSELPKSAYGVISGGAGDTPGATLAPQL